MDSFFVSGPEVTGNSKAVLAIGATAKAWLRQIHWVDTSLPLGLVFKYKASNKHRTPVVQRCQRLQKRLAKRFRGRPGNSEKFYVAVLEGELENESVRIHS